MINEILDSPQQQKKAPMEKPKRKPDRASGSKNKDFLD
jgi:hypothetical protein